MAVPALESEYIPVEEVVVKVVDGSELVEKRIVAHVAANIAE